MLRNAGNSLDAFEHAFQEGPHALHVACIMYGTSLLYPASDAFSNKYRVFDLLDRAGDALPNAMHSDRNPFTSCVRRLRQRCSLCRQASQRYCSRKKPGTAWVPA